MVLQTKGVSYLHHVLCLIFCSNITCWYQKVLAKDIKKNRHVKMTSEPHLQLNDAQQVLLGSLKDGAHFAGVDVRAAATLRVVENS